MFIVPKTFVFHIEIHVCICISEGQLFLFAALELNHFMLPSQFPLCAFVWWDLLSLPVALLIAKALGAKKKLWQLREARASRNRKINQIKASGCHSCLTTHAAHGLWPHADSLCGSGFNYWTWQKQLFGHLLHALRAYLCGAQLAITGRSPLPLITSSFLRQLSPARLSSVELS